MRAPLALLMALALSARPACADDSLAIETLNHLKAATVYIKVKLSAGHATGTGFVVHVDGAEAIVITNEHVIHPKPDATPQPRGPVPRGPFPRIPFPGGGMQADDPGSVQNVEVVFHSGRKNQQTLKAEILAADNEIDLAVLRVTGVQEPPKVVDLTPKSEVVETMPIWTFGFPFGESLSPDTRSNPAVTVGKAAISSLRENSNGEVARIQFEGEINPGNSGGPVVDARGRLVGVTTAKVRDTRIGFAVPAVEVTKLMKGRPGPIQVFARSVDGKHSEVKAVVRLTDPFRKVRGVVLRYVVSDALDMPHVAQRDGVWPPLPNAATTELKLTRSRAEGILKVEFSGKPVRLFVQAALNLEDGSVWYGPSSRVTVSPDTPRQTVTPGEVAGVTRPQGDLNKPFQVDKFKVTPLPVDGRAWSAWADDGKCFYLLEEKGVLRRFGLAQLQENAKRDFATRCAGLAVSAEGIVLAETESNKVAVVDPSTLETRKEIALPGPSRVAAAPTLSKAFTVDRDRTLCVLDLKKGTVARRYARSGPEWNNIRLDKCGISPDGKYFFCTETWGEVCRFRIDGDELKLEQRSPKIVFGPTEGFCFSPEARHVSLPTASGNRTIEGAPPIPGGGTYIFAIDDLEHPLFGIPNAPGGVAMAFDAKTGELYSHDLHSQLLVCDARGVKHKSYSLGGGSVSQMLAHPDGGALLVIANGKLWWVETRR